MSPPSPRPRPFVCAPQGDEDEIVPPEQSELMWKALKDKGLPTTLMMYKVGGGSTLAWWCTLSFQFLVT
jgi:hypothetical protein